MITSSIFGHTKTGESVGAYCLENSRGSSVTVLDYGCTVQALKVPNAQGGLTDVVLGYNTVSEYEGSLPRSVMSVPCSVVITFGAGGPAVDARI